MSVQILPQIGREPINLFPPIRPPACLDCGGAMVHRVSHVGGIGLIGATVCETADTAPYLPAELRHYCGAPNAEGRAFLAWYDRQSVEAVA